MQVYVQVYVQVHVQVTDRAQGDGANGATGGAGGAAARPGKQHATWLYLRQQQWQER